MSNYDPSEIPDPSLRTSIIIGKKLDYRIFQPIGIMKFLITSNVS